MSTSKELENLQNKRAELENDFSRLDEQEKNLETRVKILEERIAVEEWENKIQTKQDAVKSLESRIEELEQRLKKPWKPDVSEEPAKLETIEPAEEQPPEETVEVRAIDDSIAPEQAQEVEESQSKHDKKKRKFF